jgi:hypothetical protein
LTGITPLVAFKESNQPQGRVALANGKLQVGDNLAKCANSWLLAVDPLGSKRPPHLFHLGTSVRRERYSDLKQVFVLKESRTAPAYGGYIAGCDYDQIGLDFEILDQKQAA